MLIHDIGIDHVNDALETLARQRAAWRNNQSRAIIASLPDVAAKVLRDAGYSVTPPDDCSSSVDQRGWLTRY